MMTTTNAGWDGLRVSWTQDGHVIHHELRVSSELYYIVVSPIYLYPIHLRNAPCRRGALDGALRGRLQGTNGYV
jgi:hypothetical protein